MGYKYEDAAALATTWGYTVTEAKAAMFNKYLNVGEEGLRDALRASNAPSVVNPGGATVDPAATHASRPLHYCDAKAVAAMWGVDVTTAKASLQALLDLGDRDQVVTYLSAMDERRRTKIMTEFNKDDPTVAAGLLEALRMRGTELRTAGEPAS